MTLCKSDIGNPLVDERSEGRALLRLPRMLAWGIEITEIRPNMGYSDCRMGAFFMLPHFYW